MSLRYGRGATWDYYWRSEVWANYVKRKMPKIHPLFAEEYDLNLKQEALCPWCKQIMLKAQFQGSQPDKKYSWDIEFINGVVNDFRWINLQPKHPWCSRKDRAKS